ncbi:FAD binding domain-containing protein [Globomyces pollinis-pini]|nr:FAD binding domain-containing protein [Globomyces pollinis-pini]
MIEGKYKYLIPILAGLLVYQVKQRFMSTKPSIQTSKNIVIVGGGLAGLTTIIESYSIAKKDNLDVQFYLIEKEKFLGGNSAKASSGINGIHTKTQIANSVEDSVDEFVRDTLHTGHCNDKSLVLELVQSSPHAIEWLETFSLSLTELSQCGGHSKPRTHRFPPKSDGSPSPIGWTIISTLSKYIKEHTDVHILTESTLVSIEQENGRIVGVKYRSKESEVQYLETNSLALTTGGFSNDHSSDSLLTEFNNSVKVYPTTNGKWATGDGIKIARNIGATLIDMNAVQLHPTAFVDLSDESNRVKILAPEALRAYGGILLNQQGKRFVNELGTRDVVSRAIIDECHDLDHIKVWLLLTEEMGNDFGNGSMKFYQGRKLVMRMDTIHELAEFIDVDQNLLRDTIESYNAGIEQKSDEFGKSVFPKTFALDGSFLLAAVTPAIHYTMGGIKIDLDGQVYGANGAINGLYAAGEVTGGVHGQNRLAGNSLLECVVFGRRIARGLLNKQYH